ncbi:MAG TPA: cytochrome c [Terriglobales bacterium]|nr:cytochrome c [Terriglobales bacterium]
MKFFVGLLIGLAIMPLGAYLYFTGGSAPVATTDSDMPFEKFLARRAQNARIDKEKAKIVPIQPTEANYLAGAELYKQHCAVCHGLPLLQKTAIAKGMYPRPPLLLEGKGVTDDEPAESYWKIFNGFRLTGMPGFSKELTETQMWQVALLVANADKLPQSAKTVLVAPPPAIPPATGTPPAINPPVSNSPALPPPK